MSVVNTGSHHGHHQPNTDEGDFVTQSDVSLGYAVSNYTHSVHGLIGKRVVLTATRARRVFDIGLASN